MKRVLVLDDSITVRMDLEDLLRGAGFEVVAVATIADADAALADGRFGAAILDMMLPDGEGIDVLRRIRTNPAMADLPVMFLSSEAEVADRLRGLRTGADEYVGKPYDRGFLLSRIRELAGVEPEITKSVLLVEPDGVHRERLRFALERAGYSVSIAGSGEEGLRAAAELRPLAIVVEHALSGIDGATVIRRIKLDAALRRIPCLLVANELDGEAEVRALDSGADALSRRDDAPEVVLARLEALLRGGPALVSGDAPSLGPKRVLVVDGDPGSASVLERDLRTGGYDVVLARSGDEALQLLPAGAVDCVLLSLALTGPSAIEVCRRFRAEAAWHDIPIFLLSSADDRDALTHGIHAGADDVIPDSTPPDGIRARIRARIRRRQTELEERRLREQRVREEVEIRARAELRAAKERAEQESRFKSSFLASMSHELRTPLNAIIGFSELLEAESFGPLNPKQMSYVRNVLSSGRHLLSIVDDILDLSKIEAGRMELHREPTPLGTLVDASQSVVAPTASQKGISIEVTVPADLPPLDADPLRMKQVLCNLLSNAVKFTPDGGRVSITARAEDGFVEVAVSDTGVGIAPEQMGRLFREFERIETPGTKTKGTGLGLALSKRLVELHDGTIEVRSRPGEGSTFTVRVPVAGRVAP